VIVSIFKVDNDSLKLHSPSLDAKLKCPKALTPANEDSGVVVPAVYDRLPEHFPSIIVTASLHIAWTASSEQIHVRPRPPILLRIPKLDAANSAAVTRKVNLARPAAGDDSIPDVDLMVFAVFEVNNNSLKRNRSAPDLEQYRSEAPAVVHDNPIVIISPVDIGSPERFPSTLIGSTLLPIRDDAQTHHHEQQTACTNPSFTHASFLQIAVMRQNPVT